MIRVEVGPVGEDQRSFLDRHLTHAVVGAHATAATLGLESLTYVTPERGGIGIAVAAGMIAYFKAEHTFAGLRMNKL
jgi:hypothetical protein